MAVEGMDELGGKLDKLAGMDETVRKAMRRQIESVRAVAVRLAPTYAGPWKFVPRGELRNSIHTKVDIEPGKVIGTCYTNEQYAAYVEFGTGPVGASNHSGVSPEVAVSYRTDGWVWQDPEGGFHHTEGMPAQPFMYPALKSMERRVTEGLKVDLRAGIRKIGG